MGEAPHTASVVGAKGIAVGCHSGCVYDCDGIPCGKPNDMLLDIATGVVSNIWGINGAKGNCDMSGKGSATLPTAVGNGVGVVLTTGPG